MWAGGSKPMEASYGKLMMWFFLITDALTFSAFLGAYGYHRFVHFEEWPIADHVFTHFPFIQGHYPLFLCCFNDIYTYCKLCYNGFSCSRR